MNTIVNFQYQQTCKEGGAAILYLQFIGQTGAGQLANLFRRQLGLDVGEGAIARAEYDSVVNNQILPLLRITFGAAFTETEGDKLKATLGDIDASPAEKKAVLRAFINQKRAQLKSMYSTEVNEAEASSAAADKTIIPNCGYTSPKTSVSVRTPSSSEPDTTLYLF